MFSKLLIANRGEIACRIARSCRRLGVAVVGVHSSADADSLHVRTIGESVQIGGAAASESYLNVAAVVAAAKSSGAEAIHPGYGFLAENAAFARAVEKAGLVFIGPRPETIERLGDKAAAKREAAAAGLPILPGSTNPSARVASIERVICELKLPVMLKAAAGGGGKGMRVISTLDHLADEIESATREAKNAFGAGGLIVEKLIERGRHIEVQIAGDGQGNVVHLFERECTLQRRHQKLIEEAPAANLAAHLRERMLQDAVRLGKRLRYRGLGTVEFIICDENYYFLEVNPRLQVEHPVTELVTGTDLVEIMIRLAAGQGLPFAQEALTCRGHAVEARICAEDPNAGFLPSSGELVAVHFPSKEIRVETGVETGSKVTPYYDSLLAKIITHACSRYDAIEKLHDAIGEIAIFGVATNQDFLRRLIRLPETRNATFYTRLIDERLDELIAQPALRDRDVLAAAACFWMDQRRTPAASNPWQSRATTGWHMVRADDGLSPLPVLHLKSSGIDVGIRFGPMQADGFMSVAVDDTQTRTKLEPMPDGRLSAIIGSRIDAMHAAHNGDRIYVHARGQTYAFTAASYLNFASAAQETSSELRAPMTGIVRQVKVAVGDLIKVGDIAVVMESMKMELRIRSELDGRVSAVNCGVGDTVDRNAVLVISERDAS